jgi:hypothetical protein
MGLQRHVGHGRQTSCESDGGGGRVHRRNPGHVYDVCVREFIWIARMDTQMSAITHGILVDSAQLAAVDGVTLTSRCFISGWSLWRL